MTSVGFHRYQAALLTAFVFVAILACIHPPYPDEQWLQQTPIVLCVVLLVATSRSLPLSNVSFTLIVLFLLLHVVGARYVYTFTPYDEWTRELLGFELGERLGFKRNNYDRLVHFCFGLLLVHPLREVVRRVVRPRRGWSACLAIQLVMVASLIYELSEWGVAMTFSPDTAQRYLGQQGDAWDAHKDMGLAASGALIAMAITLLMGRGARAARSART